MKLPEDTENDQYLLFYRKWTSYNPSRVFPQVSQCWLVSLATKSNKAIKQQFSLKADIYTHLRFLV